MSHNKIPTVFNDQTVLLGNILTKVTADGASSPLIAFFAQKGIVLADDVASGVTAAGHYANNLTLTKQGEKYCEDRDTLMLPITVGLNGSFQFLKPYYAPMYKTMGDWDVTITTGGKITLPTDVAGWTTLLTGFKAKNDSYVSPEISPLEQYLVKKNISLSDYVTSIAAAAVLETNMKSAKSDAGKAHNDMVNEWALPLKHIRMIGVFLMKLYSGDEKALGEYGYTVVNSTKVLKTRNIRIPFGFTKLKQKAKLGGAFINIGTETLWIYKGKIVSGAPIVLLPGAKFIIPKGYSSFCVTNTSAVNSAKLQVVPPKKVA